MLPCRLPLHKDTPGFATQGTLRKKLSDLGCLASLEVRACYGLLLSWLWETL